MNDNHLSRVPYQVKLMGNIVIFILFILLILVSINLSGLQECCKGHVAEILSYFSTILCILFYSMDTGVIPADLLLVLISPVHKGEVGSSKELRASGSH